MTKGSLVRLVKLADNMRDAQKALKKDQTNEELVRAVGRATMSYDNVRAQYASGRGQE